MTDSTDFSPALPIVDRQQERMDAVPAFYKTEYERLACELALMPENVEDTFASYGYSIDEASVLLESKPFLVILERVKREIHENGVSFRAKARVISEALLPHAYDMAVDTTCPSATRAQLIMWAAKVAGHEPKESKDEGKTGGGLVLSITFAGKEPQQVITSREPVLIEQGD